MTLDASVVEFCFHVYGTFGAFRTRGEIGGLKRTLSFMPPSAAYGILLNYAAIEMFTEDGKLRKGLPSVSLALGTPKLPEKFSILSHWHTKDGQSIRCSEGAEEALRKHWSVPVSDGEKLKKSDLIYKWQIRPVWLGFLYEVDCYVMVRCEPFLLDRIKDGLEMKLERKGGLPYLGTNFCPIHISELVESVPECLWFRRVKRDEDVSFTSDAGRAELWPIVIDRTNGARSEHGMFRPTGLQNDIPEDAWVTVDYSKCSSANQ